MNIEDNIPRGCSISSNSNRQRTVSIESYTSSIDYTEWMQVHSNNILWAEQLKMKE